MLLKILNKYVYLRKTSNNTLHYLINKNVFIYNLTNDKWTVGE